MMTVTTQARVWYYVRFCVTILQVALCWAGPGKLIIMGSYTIKDTIEISVLFVKGMRQIRNCSTENGVWNWQLCDS